MSALTILSAVLIFAAVTLLVYGLFLQFAPRRAAQRLAQATGTAPPPATAAGNWVMTVARLSGPFARLSLPSEGWESSPLRQRFLQAGIRRPAAVNMYFAAKTALALGLPALGYALIWASGAHPGLSFLLLFMLLLAAIGDMTPNVVLSRLAFHRQRSIFEAFPDAADMMLVCVESGLGLDAALAKTAEELKISCVPLAQELHLVNLEIQAGSSRSEALRNLSLRCGVDSVEAFVTMLIQAERFGTSIGDSLRVFSQELRNQRRIRAEEAAAKIPIKLLFPLVFCIFPALLFVLLGPAVIQVWRTLLPLLHGGGG